MKTKIWSMFVINLILVAYLYAVTSTTVVEDKSLVIFFYSAIIIFLLSLVAVVFPLKKGKGAIKKTFLTAPTYLITFCAFIPTVYVAYEYRFIWSYVMTIVLLTIFLGYYFVFAREAEDIISY